MNNFDVAGLLKTYSEKCLRAKDSESLKKIVIDLKRELNTNEIQKMKVEN